MNLEPLLHAPLPVQIHVATVVPAFILGTYQIFLSKKGSPGHRTLGYVYLALMTVTAIAAAFIHSINPNGFLGLSWIHIFVLVTLVSVVGAIVNARKHNIRGHRASMIGLYIGGILIAGTLAFMPGRIMHSVVFGN